MQNKRYKTWGSSYKLEPAEKLSFSYIYAPEQILHYVQYKVWERTKELFDARHKAQRRKGEQTVTKLCIIIDSILQWQDLPDE